jgi:hypothetical protein
MVIEESSNFSLGQLGLWILITLIKVRARVQFFDFIP